MLPLICSRKQSAFERSPCSFYPGNPYRSKTQTLTKRFGIAINVWCRDTFPPRAVYLQQDKIIISGKTQEKNHAEFSITGTRRLLSCKRYRRTPITTYFRKGGQMIAQWNKKKGEREREKFLSPLCLSIENSFRSLLRLMIPLENRSFYEIIWYHREINLPTRTFTKQYIR